MTDHRLGFRIVTLLQSAWLRPFLFICFIVILWDVAIRVLKIPPYQIPAPEHVLRTLWSEWPLLLAQAVPTTIATVLGSCSRPFSGSSSP